MLHQQSGRGRLRWTDAAGIRPQKLLPGPFNSPESLVARPAPSSRSPLPRPTHRLACRPTPSAWRKSSPRAACRVRVEVNDPARRLFDRLGFVQ
ncbi:MAG: hypothetical protein U0804_11540 [Gemmataceae bacterium]